MAIILTSYYRPHPGGFCKRLFRTIDALLERGHEVHYLAVEPFPIRHPRCFFHPFPWSAQRTEGFLFWAFFHLAAPVLLLRIAVFFRCNRFFAFGHTYALLLQPARMVKKSTLSVFLRADTIQNHILKNRPLWLIRLEHLLEGLAVFHSAIYGVSDVLTRTVAARHPVLKPRKAKTLRNDIQSFSAEKKTESLHVLNMTCAGILEERKNQALLLEACGKLFPEGWILNIYGIGPDKEKLEGMAREKRLEEKVRFHGWQPREAIYRQTDLLLMPSIHEGAPNTVLEAFENGIPVIASDIAEHREILPAEALCPVNDPDKWAKLLQVVINNPRKHLARLRENQAPFARTLYFNWDETISRHILNE